MIQWLYKNFMDNVSNNKIILIIDESYGKDFCATSIVYIQGLNNYYLIIDQLRKISINPAFKIYNSSGILHYNENSISARQIITPWISEMPISVHVAITKTSIPETKRDKDNISYKLLFPEILKPILMKFKKTTENDVKFILNFENLSDKTNNDVIYFKKIIENISTKNNIFVNVVTKEEEPLLFLPDYFLGFIHNHLTRKTTETWSTDSLKLLSDKIGLISVFNEGKIIRYERGSGIINFLS